MAVAAVIIISCTKTIDNTKNPYDSITKTTKNPPVIKEIDSSTITGIYTFILSKKCAIPSCHGKMFEPDFSSVEASYNTLVWHKVIKNDVLNTFTYRVVPRDTSYSWLHERLVTGDSILGRMPRYAPPLTNREMYHINKWIMNGAKDANGNTASPKPNNNIFVQEIIAYDDKYNRCDTARASYYSAFKVPYNKLLHFYFYVYDVETKVDKFLDNKVRFSTDPFDFSKAIEVNAVLDTTYHIWKMDINSNQFTKGKTVYVRYSGRDTDHSTPIEFPTNTTQSFYIDHYSFIVK